MFNYKIKWSLRLKNPVVIISFLITAISTMVGASGQTLTFDSSWSDLFEMIKTCLARPYVLISVISSFIGIVNDPTTKGLGDSHRVLDINSHNTNITKIKNEGGK